MTKLSIRTLLALGVVLALGAGKSWADTVTFNNSALDKGGSVSIGSTITLTGGAADAVAGLSSGYVITGTCGSAGAGCLGITTGAFVGPVTTTTANDYAYSGGGTITVTGGISSLGIPNGTTLFSGTFNPSSTVVLTYDDSCVTNPTQCTGSIQGTLAPGLLNSTLATALGVSPSSLGGDNQNLFFAFSGVSLPVGGAAPSGTASGNTNQLEVITPGGGGSGQSTVPEPGSLVLLGSGLVGAARFARRRLAK